MCAVEAQGGVTMRQMGILYLYELKKIMRRKIVWISMAISVAVIVFTVGGPMLDFLFGEEGEETLYEAFLTDRAYQQALEGRPIDQTLLEEMAEGYSKLPKVEVYSGTEEYQTYARPYSAIFHFVRVVADMRVAEALDWEADEEELYLRRQAALAREADSYGLTQEEKGFWQGQEERFRWPVEFRYKEGWWRLHDCLYTIALLGILMAAVCLSGVFTEEHARRMDQLILSSRHGRQTVYLAKFLAGLTFGLAQALVFTAVTFLTAFAIYGAEGFWADFRLARAGFFPPMSIGQAVLLCYGCMTAAMLVTAAFVMTLSEVTKSSIGTLSTVAGMILLSMFVNVPERFRVLSQLWSYLPSEFTAVWNIFNPRTVPLFGTFLLSWQAAPLLYLLLGIGFALIGKRAFVGYQVSGR